MKKVRHVGFVALLLILLITNAHAFLGLYFGLQGGWAQEKATFESIKFNTDTSFLYGVKAGIRSANVALELDYHQVAHNLNPANPADTWAGRKVDYSYIGLNLRWLFSLLFLNPYLTGGYGYYTADIQSVDTQKKGGFNVGAGLELRLGRKFALVAEGKYHRASFDVQAGTVGTLTLNHWTLSGGFNLYF